MAEKDNIKTIAQVVAWMEDDEMVDHADLVTFPEDGHIGLRRLADIVFRAHNYELAELREKLEKAEFDLREVISELAKAKKDLAEARADAKTYLDALADPDIH